MRGRTGKTETGEITQIIKSKDRRKAGHTAPPQGLYLVEIYYDSARMKAAAQMEDASGNTETEVENRHKDFIIQKEREDTANERYKDCGNRYASQLG